MSSEAAEEFAIEIRGLRKQFGRKRVLEGVDLRVKAGQTFAFLGRNGAGKTTTIRMLLGLLRPEGGEVRVLGLDPQRDPLAVRSRVGYLAEDQAMFPWMRVQQLLAFMKPFYPTWNDTRAKDLLERFELSATTKVKHLSKGQNVKLGLLLALAHEPSLVILDDPTLGLDPIMRKEFLRDIVNHLQGGAVTVFFSSHLLYEVEPVADAVAILDRGRIVRCEPTEVLRDSVKRVLLPADAYARLGKLPGILDLRQRGEEVSLVVENIQQLSLPGAARIVDLNLDEIFEAYVIGQVDRSPEARQLATAGSL